MKKIAVYAGESDPPELRDRTIAQLLAARCDEVVVLPFSDRADTLPIHRAVMADLNFRGLERVRVDLCDLERNQCTLALDELVGGQGIDVIRVVAASAVQSLDPKLLSSRQFAILREPGELAAFSAAEKHILIDVPPREESAHLRSRLYEGYALHDRLAPPVESYIQRHALYRPTPPTRDCLFCIADPVASLFYDPANPTTHAIAEQLQSPQADEPNYIAVIGGDGTMLRAIRARWRERLPFYGLNTGQVGFLLNDPRGVDLSERDLHLYQLPLLWVETIDLAGRRGEWRAFNDCWVERHTGQSAWVEVSVNGQVRVPRMVCDGVLISTAAGSTSYSRAMGATPLPFNAPLLTLVGSNVFRPTFHPAVLTIDSEVTLRGLDPEKRPLQGYVDGTDIGEVREMSVRVSRTAAVELLFTAEHDPAAKLAMLQFPQPE